MIRRALRPGSRGMSSAQPERGGSRRRQSKVADSASRRLAALVALSWLKRQRSATPAASALRTALRMVERCMSMPVTSQPCMAKGREKLPMPQKRSSALPGCISRVHSSSSPIQFSFCPRFT